MTFFFDLTPFVVIAAIALTVIVGTVFIFCVSILQRLIWLPLKHRRTGLKLYRFEKQVYNDRVIDEAWLKSDRDARAFQSHGDFYSFCTKEVYPKLRYINKNNDD